MTNTNPADLRLVAFTLARALRALRSLRLERALELLQSAQRLAETLPQAEAQKAVRLIEALADRGIDLETERLELERTTFSRRLRLVVSK
jgi:hypothetical protein